MAHQIRTCLLCGKTDDHPRLVMVSTLPGHPDINYHHDCFVIANPDDGSDPGVTEIHALVAAAKGKQGDALRKFLEAQPVKEVA